MRLDELNAQERRLWDAFPTGRPVDLRDGPSPSDPVVRSEVVAALLLGANPDHDPGDRPALRLTGARLTGCLDIGFTEVAVPVRLTDCRFDEAPLLQGARTRELALTGCVLPGLLADTAQIDGWLVVSHCTLTGPLVLTRTQVNGDLDLRGTVVRHPAGEAIPAVHAHVGGDALCADLAVEGTFRLSGASIEGEFDLEGATLRAPGGHALDAYHIRVAEDFTCHPGFSAEGRIILSGATVAAAIGFCGARLSNPGDIA
ncbi:oxidoreductase, partial [Streptomyces violaceoruber]